ncbi:hypothetical protein ACFWU3_06755 [Streptomyces sp. NPDC058685]|uniref:hypothetical protein n=1 Tax=Streptomyces sp. NPDC058685 TaxID=3346598 RepID=UPI003667861A
MDNDDNAPETPDDGLDLASLYLESVKARMDPEQFATLEEAVDELAHMLSDGQPGTFEAGGRDSFTPDVQREFLAVMAILTTGRMDHHIVELPGPDGSTGYAVVTAEVANDPEKLAEFRADLHRQITEQQAVDEELDGIARASGLDTGD